MTNEQIIDDQIAWIKSGKIGCVFASVLVKQADKIGWQFEVANPCEGNKMNIKDSTFIYSLIFPDKDVDFVRKWALRNGFFIEDVAPMCEGLRIKCGENVSWVQYFWQDSHVKTRQSPHPMLTFTVKLPAHVYAKTMIKGIYHLAHASIEFLTAKKANTLWEQSYIKTRKELGRAPEIAEAAKTTFRK